MTRKKPTPKKLTPKTELMKMTKENMYKDMRNHVHRLQGRISLLKRNEEKLKESRKKEEERMQIEDQNLRKRFAIVKSDFANETLRLHRQIGELNRTLKDLKELQVNLSKKLSKWKLKSQ